MESTSAAGTDSNEIPRVHESHSMEGGSRQDERCLVCGQMIDKRELAAHVQADNESIRSYILSAIRQAHPKWIASDGTCPKCWDRYPSL